MQNKRKFCFPFSSNNFYWKKRERRKTVFFFFAHPNHRRLFMSLTIHSFIHFFIHFFIHQHPQKTTHYYSSRHSPSLCHYKSLSFHFFPFILWKCRPEKSMAATHRFFQQLIVLLLPLLAISFTPYTVTFQLTHTHTKKEKIVR